MRVRVAGGVVGAIFGATLCWTGMISPNVIREALLFENSYLFLFFGSAVVTGAIGLQILKRVQRRAALTDKPLTFAAERPQRRHVAGALMFGIGWGVADVCPGPILAQLGQGIGWGVITFVGVVGGVYFFLRQGA